MTKERRKEQRRADDALDEAVRLATAEPLAPAVPLVLIGPFDVTGTAAGGSNLPAGKVLIMVDKRHGEAFHVREETERSFAYCTVQRIDLATRLQLPDDYEPDELPGRAFLLDA